MREGGALHVRLAGARGDLRLDAHLRAEPGAVTLLTGASGAGKTTLLRAIAGLEHLDGEVRLGDETWQAGKRSLPVHRRGIGFVLQQGGLFPHLDVAANLRYGLARSVGARDAFDAIVGALSLAPFLVRGPGELSGGERRRVSLGRALLMKPRLLLLDEPLSGLDAAAKRDVHVALRALLIEANVPVILVSHDQDDAGALADVRLHLRDGSIFPENRVDRVEPTP